MFKLFFVSGEDDLRAITIRMEGGPTSGDVRVFDGEGRLVYARAARLLVPGENRIELERIEDARGMWFVVEIAPAEPVSVVMAELPRAPAVASAQLDGRRLSGSAVYTLHHETTWSTLLGDAMYEELKDLRFSPPILLKKMVVAGQLGRKSGKGFYDY